MWWCLFFLLSTIVNVLMYLQGWIAKKNAAQMSSDIALSDSIWARSSNFIGTIIGNAFCCFTPYLHLRIPWRSVPKIMTMNHLGIFSGRFLKLPWRIEIGIQWYIWLSPQLVFSLVPAKIWLVWWLIRGQTGQVVFSSGWIHTERHWF